MAHYRRCRAIRAKQAGQNPGRRAPNQEHVCLVCSLVARQARSALELGCSHRSSSHSSVSSSRKTSSRKVISSFMLNADNEIVAPSTQQKKMPPPPPRVQSTTSASAADEPIKFESPPSSHNLQQKASVSIAAAVAPTPSAGSLMSLEVMGKSVDTAKGSFMRPPKEVPQGRARSASCVDSKEEVTKTCSMRARSASCGDTLSNTIPTTVSGESGTCETILEEGEEYHQSNESIDLEFNLARRGHQF